LDLQQTRMENDQRLGPHLEAIARGEMLDALEPFAKAYLGLYYQLDNSVPPRQRVASLANEQVTAAIMQGMQSLLLGATVPSAREIGEACLQGHGIGVGYVLLAAVEEFCTDDVEHVLKLDERVMAALLCYQFLHTSFQPLPWHERLLQQSPQAVIKVLQQFWKPMQLAGKDFLPGLQTLIRGPRYAKLASSLAIPLLKQWPQGDIYSLRRLMQRGLASEETAPLLSLAELRVAELPVAEIRRKVYWLVTAFIIEPQGNTDGLSQYIGRTKEKVLPLLDYLVALLQDPCIERRLSAMDLARLLRIIAPVFARNQGRGGLLDDNSTRVLWLFEQLAAYPEEQRRVAAQWLSTVRVMRSYADILASL